MGPVFELTIISNFSLTIYMPPVWVRKQHQFFSSKEAAIIAAEAHAFTNAQLQLNWCKHWPGYHSTQYANAWRATRGEMNYYYQIRSSHSQEAEWEKGYRESGGLNPVKWS